MRRILSAIAFVGLTGTLAAQAPTLPQVPVGGYFSYTGMEKRPDGTLQFKDFSITVGQVTITGSGGTAVAIPGGFQFTGTTAVRVVTR